MIFKHKQKSEFKIKCAACGKEKSRDDMAVINRRGTKINGKMINKERAVCQSCNQQDYDVDGMTDEQRHKKMLEKQNER